MSSTIRSAGAAGSSPAPTATREQLRPARPAVPPTHLALVAVLGLAGDLDPLVRVDSRKREIRPAAAATGRRRPASVSANSPSSGGSSPTTTISSRSTVTSGARRTTVGEPPLQASHDVRRRRQVRLLPAPRPGPARRAAARSVPRPCIRPVILATSGPRCDSRTSAYEHYIASASCALLGSFASGEPASRQYPCTRASESWSRTGRVRCATSPSRQRLAHGIAAGSRVGGHGAGRADRGAADYARRSRAA